MKSEFGFVVIIILLIEISYVLSHTNPCPQFWQYVTEGGNYQGRITIPDPPVSDTLKVKLVLSISGTLPTDYEGTIELLNDGRTGTRNIFSGTGRQVVYKVLFPIQRPVPVISDLQVNGRSICRGYSAHGSISTNIKLFHTLGSQSSQQAIPTRPNPRPNYAVQYQNENINRDQISDYSTLNNDICGETYDRAIGLVVSGTSYKRGEWPWLSALFFKNEFICGGTLVSNSHVITAAHCIQNKDDNRKRVSEMYFILGGHNLNENDSLTKTISTFIAHPDWNPKSERFDADIAIAVLSSTVHFTKFIRPACLFVPGVHPENIAGSKATLAGWGRRADKRLSTDDPQMIQIPVVTNDECLRSNSVFSKITSARTFCAGSRDGRGPCTGDSGGGLLIPYFGKWVLRGIISASLIGTEIECNVHEFLVFTDVAKFSRWIRDYIE